MLERKQAIRFSAALSNLHTPGLPRRGQKQAAPPAVRGAPPAAPVRAAGATPAPGRGQAFRAAAVPADPPAQPSPRAHCDQAERAVIRPNGRRDYPRVFPYIVGRPKMKSDNEPRGAAALLNDAIMLTEAPLYPRQTARMTQSHFETFNNPNLYVQIQPPILYY